MHRTWIFVVLLIVAAAASTDFSSPHVEILTDGNFAEKTADGKLWFIKFYAPWCGHCKKLAPAWGELGESFKENKDVVIAHVDCTVHKGVCQKAEIKGYPTLKLYYNGQMHKKFEGARGLDQLKKFVNDGFQELFAETTS